MDAGSSIQRIKKDSSLHELQPPPYQDEGSAACMSSRSRSERAARKGSPPQRRDSPCCSSETSEDQDTESYLNKGCEEDIPSDSTAVLGPEVRLNCYWKMWLNTVSTQVKKEKGDDKEVVSTKYYNIIKLFIFLYNKSVLSKFLVKKVLKCNLQSVQDNVYGIYYIVHTHADPILNL